MHDRESPNWVAIADGDEVGRLLDKFAIANDDVGLVRASRIVDADREKLAEWLRGGGAEVLLCVADTVIAKGQGAGPDGSTFPEVQLTWSIGLGRDLAGAHAALAVAKATGRDRSVDGRTWEGDLKPFWPGRDRALRGRVERSTLMSTSRHSCSPTCHWSLRDPSSL
jgi:hypothetical protein